MHQFTQKNPQKQLNVSEPWLKAKNYNKKGAIVCYILYNASTKLCVISNLINNSFKIKGNKVIFLSNVQSFLLNIQGLHPPWIS